ncbi:hypothetical protein QQF73_03395 [Marinobacter sp. M216]|uniref:Uncharacterized protein n=1 Tax=Marinobacter albus TaxID=3030833 RepID=A0ABT7H9N0_9GAMM|nr:hypothetical protein [Marinobacter sp. M216]MDK9556657.1 hypothetical protein [Marinobacter sp. M216]
MLYEAKTFRCRKCLNLSYRSQKETDSERAIRRAEKVRERLGWRAGILCPNGGKPKGMHHRTFFTLTSLQHHLQQQAMGGLLAAIDRLN